MAVKKIATKTRKPIDVERKDEFKVTLPSGHTEVLTYNEAENLYQALGNEF